MNDVQFDICLASMEIRNFNQISQKQTAKNGVVKRYVNIIVLIDTIFINTNHLLWFKNLFLQIIKK